MALVNFSVSFAGKYEWRNIYKTNLLMNILNQWRPTEAGDMNTNWFDTGKVQKTPPKLPSFITAWLLEVLGYDREKKKKK